MEQPPYGHNPYGAGYGYAPVQASANALDIILGVLQVLAALLGIIGSALMAFAGGMVASGSIEIQQQQPNNAQNNALAQMFGVGGGLITAFGFIMLAICIIFFVAGIGMIRFKKWAFITTAVLILLQIGLLGYSLATQPQTWQTNNYVYAGVLLFWMIYCFIRAPRAN